MIVLCLVSIPVFNLLQFFQFLLLHFSRNCERKNHCHQKVVNFKSIEKRLSVINRIVSLIFKFIWAQTHLKNALLFQISISHFISNNRYFCLYVYVSIYVYIYLILPNFFKLSAHNPFLRRLHGKLHVTYDYPRPRHLYICKLTRLLGHTVSMQAVRNVSRIRLFWKCLQSTQSSTINSEKLTKEEI